MAKQANVISHWGHLFENFQTSSLAFYESVEAAVQARAVPETNRARVEHKEGGLASAKREYLRLHRGKHAFDICAAPFGTGYFFSWWFTEPPLAFGILYALAFLLGVVIAMNVAFVVGAALGAALQGLALSVLFGGSFAIFGVPAILWLLGNAMREGKIGGESIVLAMPLIGGIYERIFAPPTYYAVDTALMFQDAVHNAVMEVIDCVTAVPSPPDGLLTTLIERVIFRRKPGITASLGHLARLIIERPTALNSSQAALLSASLLPWHDATVLSSTINSAGEFHEHERPGVRMQVAYLAGALRVWYEKSIEPAPPGVQRWKDLCASDRLPEIRRAFEVRADVAQ